MAVAGNSFTYTTATAATYDFTITDSEGCSTLTSVIVAPLSMPVATHLLTDPSCDGAGDGIVEVQVDTNFGTAPYEIDFDGSGFSAQTVYNGLNAGTYTYTVRDAKSCTYSDTVTLTAPNAMAGDAVIVQDYTCLQSGSLQAQNVSGGTAPYEYSLDGVTFGASDTFTNLADGTYNIFIRDANACVYTTPDVTIPALDPPTDITFAATPPNCPTETSDITLSVTAGVGSLTYEIIAPAAAVMNNGNNPVFTGLTPDTYTFRVTDANDCSYEENFTLNPVQKIQADGDPVNDVSCVGSSDGSLQVDVMNFSTTYAYTLNSNAPVTGQNAASFTINSLPAGTHTVVITDETTNCTDTVNVTIAEPSTPLSFTYVSTPKTCAEGATVTMTAQDGWPQYTYEVVQPDGTSVGPQNSGFFSDLDQEGNYTLRVRDSGGCVVDQTLTVTAPSNPVASLDTGASQVCYESTSLASVTVAVAGGQAPFVYQLRRNAGSWSGTQTSATFNDLIPGDYDFKVIDSYGCEDSFTYTISEELIATAYLMKDQDCSGTPEASIDLVTAGGYTPFTFEIEVNGGGYNPYGGGFPYTTNVPGTYRFRVTDTQGCTAESNVITVTPATTPQATVDLTDPSCFGNTDGVVEVVIDPNFGAAPYQVSFNGGPFASQTVFSGLGAGTYSFTVVDAKGCSFTDTTSAVLTDPDQFLANVVPTDVSCDPGGSGDILGRIDISISSGGVGDLYYTLYDNMNSVVGTSGPHTNADAVAFTGLDFGDYYVRIVDANGCEYYENPVRILASPFLSLDTVTASDCIAGGTATLTAAGGSGDYDFWIYGTAIGPDSEVTIDATTERAVFNGLNPGQTYIIQALDNNTNCNSYQEVIVPPVSNIAVVADPVVTDYSCSAASDGTITFQVQDYDTSVTNINYSLLEAVSNNPVVGFSGSVSTKADFSPTDPFTLSGIPAGDYVLLLKENESPFCSTTYEFRIIEPLPINLDIVDQNNANCNELAQLTVRANGGYGSYEYAFMPSGNVPAAGDFQASGYTELDPATDTNWDVYVRDSGNCISGPTAVTIATDPSPQFTAAVSNQCAGPEGNYTIDLNLDQAGIAPHTISINGGAFQATSMVNTGDTMSLTGLNSGTYDLVIQDSNGCQFIHPTVTIYKPSSLSAEATAQPTCTGNDGSVVITPYGGSGVYTYELIDSGGNSVSGGPQALAVFTNLAAGVYQAWVYDALAGGCSANVSIELEVPTAVSFTTTQENVSCNGGADGTITANLDPGNDNPPYSYTLLDGLGLPIEGPKSGKTFRDLPAGNYEVLVISGRGCQFRQPVTITEPSPVVASATATDFSCAADNSVSQAQITVTGGGGTAPYQYSKDGVNFFSNNVFNVTDNGTPQTITVYVRDTNGCTDDTNVTINPIPKITSVDFTQLTAITCINDEVVEVSVNGGTGDYNFELLPSGSAPVQSPGAGFSTANFTLSTPGDYTFRITDNGTGCTFVSTPYTIAPYDTIGVVATAVTPVTCFGDSDGELNIEVTGYTGNYDYRVFLADGTPTAISGSSNTTANPLLIGGLQADNVYVEVTATDTPFCGDLSNTITIGSPNAPLAVVEDTNVNANCNSGALVSVTGSGGTAPYTYAFVPAGDSPAAAYGASANATLSPATYPADYDVYIQDARGCTEMITITVNEDPLPTVTAPAFAADQCTSSGAAYTFTVAGTGVGPLQYDAGNGFQASNTLTVNGPGTYTVTVRDANGCTATDTITITEPLAVSPSVSLQASCALNDGEITMSATGGSGAYEFELFDAAMVSLGRQAGNVFAGLSPGSFTAVVYDMDGSGCDAQASITLETPTPVTFSTIVTDISCNGVSDGIIEVDLPSSNDNPAYTFTLDDGINPPITQNGRIFSGLAAGNYDITVRSARNCTDVQTVTVTEPALLTLTASNTEFGCNASNGVNQATISTVTTGGTAPYVYSIDGTNFQSSNSFQVSDTGLTQNLTITVKDANGCTTTDNVSIEPLNVFSVDVSQLAAISCSNPERVQLIISDDGDAANTYTIELLPVGNPAGTMVATPSNTVAEFELTQVGTYNFRITDDATGCYFITADYVIDSYDLIDVTATVMSNETCFGASDGSMEIDITDYTGAYTYEVFDQAGASTGIIGSGNTTTNPMTINGLPGGNLYVRVTATDAPFCPEDSNLVQVEAPTAALTVASSEQANVECTNDQGEILVDPAGGYAPYTINLINTTTGQSYAQSGVNSGLFTGLSAGVYDVSVSDAGGCTVPVNGALTLVQPNPISADISASTTNLACFGDTNASVSAISVSGGQGTYQYRLHTYDGSGNLLASSGLQQQPTFNNLGAGTYSIEVTDGWSCDVETVTVTISEPTEVQSSLRQVSGPTCNTQASIEISAGGGTAPYEFSVDGSSYTPMAGGNTHTMNVAPGTYQYYVRDANGCVFQRSNQVTVEALDPLQIDVDASAAVINCNGEATATIFADASGALGNYSYALFSDAALTNQVAAPQASGKFSGLTAGTYFVQVQSGDCEEVTSAITINEPTPLQADLQQSTNVTCNGANDGSITVEVSGGSGDIIYAISPNLNKFSSDNTFTDLEPGTYEVIAQDVNGCFLLFDFTIEEPEVLEATFTVQPEVCQGSEDGIISLAITGGTAPYATALNTSSDSAFQADRLSYTDLPSGTHVVFIKDAEGCETNVIVEVDAGVNLNATVEPIYECSGAVPDNSLEISLEDPSIADDVMYAIDTTDPSAMKLEADFSNLAPGSHYLTISHANGCVRTIDFEIASFDPLQLELEQRNINEITAIANGGNGAYTFYFDGREYGDDETFYINRTDTYTVMVEDESGCIMAAEIFMEFIDIEIPDHFTPNGDGVGDTWAPQNMEGFPEILTIIFDRYGREVHRMGVNDDPFEGLYQRRDLPSGDYWYVIKLNGENDPREFVGHFTLYR